VSRCVVPPDRGVVATPGDRDYPCVWPTTSGVRPCAMLRAVLSRWEDRTERTGTVVTIGVAVLTVGGCAYLLGRRHGAGQPQGVAAAGLGAGGRAGRSADKGTIATSTWTDWLLGHKPKRMPGASSIRMVIVVHRHGARVPNK
jgi:hypothetical protein